MKQEQSNLFLRFDGYKVYYKPRKNGGPECGGGTAVITRDSSIPGLIKNLDHVEIKVETSDFCFNIFSLYLFFIKKRNNS